MSSQLVVWTLTNTSSLNTSRHPSSLFNRLIAVNQYALPPKQQQPGSGTAPGTDTPQGHCINDTTTATIAGVGCWRLLFGAEPAHNEVVSTARLQRHPHAAGDVRQRQAVGRADTALNPDGGAQRAGIAWFVLNPALAPRW